MRPLVHLPAVARRVAAVDLAAQQRHVVEERRGGVGQARPARAVRAQRGVVRRDATAVCEHSDVRAGRSRGVDLEQAVCGLRAIDEVGECGAFRVAGWEMRALRLRRAGCT